VNHKPHLSKSASEGADSALQRAAAHPTSDIHPMFHWLRKRQPGQPLWKILWWHLLHGLFFLWFVPFYRYRAWGVKRIPEDGPLLIVCNHQSFFDPILVGLGAHRRQFCALARSQLFERRGLGWVIRSVNAIPVEQGTSDTRAMRGCVQALKAGHAVLVFPEGSRSLSGRTEPFESGTMLLIKRARPTVLPVAVEGGFDVWPRNQKLPRLTDRLGVMYGEPIPADTLLAQSADDALESLRQQVQQMQDELAERLHHQRSAAATSPEAPDVEPDAGLSL
jgi:1-acyl-sn-glycerol-3-phosphate acyltransferase